MNGRPNNYTNFPSVIFSNCILCLLPLSETSVFPLFTLHTKCVLNHKTLEKCPLWCHRGRAPIPPRGQWHPNSWIKKKAFLMEGWIIYPVRRLQKLKIEISGFLIRWRKIEVAVLTHLCLEVDHWLQKSFSSSLFLLQEAAGLVNNRGSCSVRAASHS